MTSSILPAVRKYGDIIMMDGPQYHDEVFIRKHPRMRNRAKIFSPFAALSGFDAFIRSKEVTYESRRILGQHDESILGYKLNRLHELTLNGKHARRNRVKAAVTFFRVCADPNSEAFGNLGTYETATGIVWNVDFVSHLITVDDKRIPFADLYCIKIIDLHVA